VIADLRSDLTSPKADKGSPLDSTADADYIVVTAQSAYGLLDCGQTESGELKETECSLRSDHPLIGPFRVSRYSQRADRDLRRSVLVWQWHLENDRTKIDSQSSFYGLVKTVMSAA
jgi:hypothetical protein